MDARVKRGHDKLRECDFMDSGGKYYGIRR
jgi:hypothetical protein